jgi:hypothetical protein
MQHGHCAVTRPRAGRDSDFADGFGRAGLYSIGDLPTFAYKAAIETYLGWPQVIC